MQNLLFFSLLSTSIISSLLPSKEWQEVFSSWGAGIARSIPSSSFIWAAPSAQRWGLWSPVLWPNTGMFIIRGWILLSLQNACSDLAPVGSVLPGVPKPGGSQSIFPENKPLCRVERTWITCFLDPMLPPTRAFNTFIRCPPRRADPGWLRCLTHHRNLSPFLPFSCPVALHFNCLLMS